MRGLGRQGPGFRFAHPGYLLVYGGCERDAESGHDKLPGWRDAEVEVEVIGERPAQLVTALEPGAPGLESRCG